jgi:hypothetical protein
MEERRCGFKIVAFVDGKMHDFYCDPSKSCLKEMVWNGQGVNAAARKVLNLSDKQTV